MVALSIGVRMDTEAFLSSVWPATGQYCILFKPPGGGMNQRFFNTIAGAARFAQAVDAKGCDVYFGCASFKDPNSRLATNALAAKAFWLDVDVGASKDYADRAEAITELKEFLNCTGLPVPAIVSSGRGLHLYWCITEELDPDEWRPIATALKRACKDIGFKADPSRTADLASVLRPVGTHHRKDAPVEVKVLKEAGPYELDEILQALESWAEEPDPLGEIPEHLRAAATDDDLVGDRRTEPAYAEIVADKCAVVNWVRNPEDVHIPQPVWYGVLGVVAKCEEGEKIAHEWSAKDDRYNPRETQRTLDRVSKFGPTTCEKLEEGAPDLCNGCEWRGKIRSPIVLGVQGTAQPVEAADHVQQLERPHAAGDEPKKISMPFPYGWGRVGGRKEQLYKKVRGQDGWEHIPVCDTLFYPISRLSLEGGEAGMEIEMVVKPGVHRTFKVPSSMVGDGGAALMGLLAKHEIMALPRMKPDMAEYLSKWVTQLKETAEAVHTRNHFGWYDREDGSRSFLLGDRMITPEGTSKVLVAGNAAAKAPAFTPKGDLATWKRVIDRGYNHAGLEAYQFMVLCAFAAPLLTMHQALGGVTVFAHSEGSGAGKTTAQQAGLAAFGNWEKLKMADKKATMNALWALIGTYSHLPVMYDELTNIANSDASDLVLSISSGRLKERLNQQGLLQENNAGWETIMLASGNVLLSEKLSLHRGNAEAEIARIFEFTVRPDPKIDPNEAADLFPLLLTNYGHAGEIYIEHVVQNYDAVQSALKKVQHRLNTELGITQAERYWSGLLSCVITALILCRQLSLLQFDVAGLRHWISVELNNNRRNKDESIGGPLDLFGNMMTDLWSGTLVTIGQGDLRVPGKAAEVILEPRGPLTGRCIIPRQDPTGKPTNEKATLAINVASVKAWCGKNGVSAREMYKALVQEGWALPTIQRVNLGKGATRYASVAPNVMCWVIDPEKAGVDAIGSIAQRLVDVSTDVMPKTGAVDA